MRFGKENLMSCVPTIFKPKLTYLLASISNNVAVTLILSLVALNLYLRGSKTHNFLFVSAITL